MVPFLPDSVMFKISEVAGCEKKTRQVGGFDSLHGLLPAEASRCTNTNLLQKSVVLTRFSLSFSFRKSLQTLTITTPLQGIKPASSQRARCLVEVIPGSVRIKGRALPSTKRQIEENT